MQEYLDYISQQVHRNPCLSYLHRFLDSSASLRYPCRIASLKYCSDRGCPLLEDVDGNFLPSILNLSKDSQLQGRLLLVEDPDPKVIARLGQDLDIDPLFFASHIHAPWRDGTSKTPEMAVLPSRLRPRDFVNIYYHRTLQLKDSSASVRKLMPESNIHRKIMVLPPGSRLSSRKGRRLALAQQCCSVLRTTLADGTWFCVILLDPPITQNFFPVNGMKHEAQSVQVPFELFLGGYEDFRDPLVFSKFTKQKDGPYRQSLFDDFLYYWSLETPASFDPDKPSLASLAYYPMKIVAEEWMSYLTVMRQTIKEYEYSLEDLDGSSTLTQELDRLKSDLSSLQSWRRRILSTRQKTQAVLRFLGACSADTAKDDGLSALEEDYKYIATEVQEYGSRLESVLPVVTSMVQIVDSRRALAETSSVTRLTYLAVVFVPLTFTSGLFSMSDDMAPGGSLFWLYFVVALPITLVVFLIARPPVRALRNKWQNLRDLFSKFAHP